MLTNIVRALAVRTCLAFTLLWPFFAMAADTPAKTSPAAPLQVKPPTTVTPPTTPATPIPKGPATTITPGGGGALPDLIVSDLFLVGDEIRFKVKNIGQGEKKPAEINYHVTIKYPGLGKPEGYQFKAIAGITSLARLRPGEETPEDRVTAFHPQLGSMMVITLCVNNFSPKPESNFDNNCLTKDASALLSDLTITQARIDLVSFKKPDKPWYEDVGDFFGDLLCPTSPGIDFDTSGMAPNVAVVTVKNNGAVPASNFSVAVTSEGGLLEKGTRKVRVTDVIEPRGSKQVSIYVGLAQCRPGDKKCRSSVRATVDPEDKVLETLEDNNSLKVATVLVRDHRKPGGGTVYGSCD
jgi:hypothetical protein